MTVDELRDALRGAPGDANVYVVTGLGNEKVTPAEFGWTGANFLSIEIHGVTLSTTSNVVRLELNDK
jgi:hypothetical protein